MPGTASAVFMRNETVKALRGYVVFPTQALAWGERPPDGSFEDVELDRFREMLGKSGPQASFNVTVIAKTADRNSRNIGDCAHLHHQIKAVAIGKGNVADEQIEFVPNGSFHG
jgi:hypothetical protein